MFRSSSNGQSNDYLKGKIKNRAFNTKWLTAGIPSTSLLCFPCFLFGGDTGWIKLGYKDLKHLSERLAKPESCGTSVENAIKLELLGKEKITAD